MLKKLAWRRGHIADRPTCRSNFETKFSPTMHLVGWQIFVRHISDFRICRQMAPLSARNVFSRNFEDRTPKFSGSLEVLQRYLSAKRFLLPVSTSGFITKTRFTGSKTVVLNVRVPEKISRRRLELKLGKDEIVRQASLRKKILKIVAARGRQSYPNLHFFQCLKNRCQAVLKDTTAKIWKCTEKQAQYRPKNFGHCELSGWGRREAQTAHRA